MKTYIYSSKNIVKTLYCDEKQILRADYENTLTGRKTRADLYGFEICYSESLSGVKKYFRECEGVLVRIDGKGYTVSDRTGRLSAEVEYRPSDSGELIKSVRLVSEDKKLFLRYVDAERIGVKKAGFVWQAPYAGRTYLSSRIARLGQPVYIEDLFFGLETPTGENSVKRGVAFFRYNTGRTFGELASDGAYEIPPLVTGAGQKAEFSYMRRAFFGYVRTFSRPSVFRLQFNSWYDNMLDITPQKIKDSFTQVYEGFKKAGLRNLDCYVIDDGWAEYKKPLFWNFNDKFKNGFSDEAALTKSLGSTFGVWFGPRGGYTSQTIKYARLLKTIGYHVNTVSKDICTADKKYIDRLCDLMCKFVTEFNVDYYKIDGFAKRPCRKKDHNHIPAKGNGLAFYTCLWEDWVKGFEKIRRVSPDICLNITSYVNCSPWFLKWADYVWMNNASDMGYAGKGSDLSMCLNYRDGRYRDFYETRQLQFPAAHVYNHEPCYAIRNVNVSKRGKKTVTYSDEEFYLYMKCCMMRGSGLAELYFSPAMMSDSKWKIAADVLKWAENNFELLSTAQFFGGRPEKGEVYGYYAVKSQRYAVMIRNSGEKERRYSFDLPEIGRVEGALKPFETVFRENL